MVQELRKIVIVKSITQCHIVLFGVYIYINTYHWCTLCPKPERKETAIVKFCVQQVYECESVYIPF